MKKFEEHSAQHDDYNYTREEPFYVIALSNEGIDGLWKYIKDIPEDEWWECIQEFGDDEHRESDIHVPLKDTFPHMVGINMFNFVNNKNYQMDVNTFEFQILRYREGGTFAWHCDYGIAPNKDVWRKLSMSVQLSDPEDYEGGELVLIDYFNRQCEIPKSKGAAVIFDSRCPHKAFPVTKGERYVLVGWANGPKLK
tara:strand:+ start:184 stop:771 length:588 start_codon:yes stop_codon:yes gene_type:complete